jgi:hypothetical protein
MKLNNLVPLEFKNQRIMTTQVLADVYRTDEKNIQTNFLRNQERFIEGKHYIKLGGEALREFKDSLPTNSREPLKFAPQLMLWTEKGAARHAKILNTDEAWQVYEELEETYFRVKEQMLPINQLSPELQMFKAIFDRVAKQELDNMQIAVTVQKTKEEVQAIREVVEIRPSENWRNETNSIVKKNCYKLNDYQRPKEELYKAVQERGACDLKRRLENMRARFLLNGGTKSKADQMNYLDVIAEDKKLIEIYTAIVKELAIKYKVA